MLILKPKTAEIFGMLLRSHELYDIKLLYVYCLPCQVLMYTCISLTFKQNKRRMRSSFLWFTFVEMLCTICKCFWLSIFFMYKNIRYLCVCWIYISIYSKISLWKFENIECIYTKMWVRGPMYFLSNFHVHVFVTLYMYVTKNTVIVKCQGQRNLICHTLICMWSVYIICNFGQNEWNWVHSKRKLISYKHVCYTSTCNCVLLEFSLSLFTSGSCC